MFEQHQTTTTQQTASKPNGKSRRGFASMDKDRHKQVSSKGGQTPRSKNETRERLSPHE